MKRKLKLMSSLLLLFFLCHAVLYAEKKQPLDIEMRSFGERETELTKIKNPLQKKYMEEWIEITRGENIALGKSISSSIKPNYEYAPKNKLENLLDGKVSKKEDGKLLFAPEAFAWTKQKDVKLDSRGIWIMVDLHEQQAIKTVAMRVMGGGKTSSQQLPRRIELLASDDGKDFFEIGVFQKLEANKADNADGEKLVYLEETGDNFVYPVRFTKLQVRARYLVFQISLTNTFFADEIAVIKGDFDPAEASFTETSKRAFSPDAVTYQANIEAQTPAKKEAKSTEIKNPLQKKYLEEWIEVTRGENIALGKSISASIEANYSHAPNNKLENLLDGKVSKREDGKLLFAPEAFAWTKQKSSKLGSRGVWIMLDLHEQQAIKTVAMRVMGGGKTSSQQLPGRIALLASDDGKDFFEVGTFFKLGANEAEAADGEKLVHLEEKGDNFVYPVRFTKLRLSARYLVFQISLTSTFFADEIAVIKGDFAPADAPFAEESRRVFIPEGIAFYPNKRVLAVSRDILTPNFFDLIDDRDAQSQKKPTHYCLELPPYLEILKHSPTLEIAPVETLASGKKKWSLQEATYSLGGRIGPLYFKVLGNPKSSTADNAVFYIEAEGQVSNRITMPLQLLDIPRATSFKNFHLSLGWMNDSDRNQWPNFLDAYEHLGFNAVPTFSYHYLWHTPPPKIDKKEVLPLLQEARERGFKILQIEPSFHLMHFAAKGEDEIYSQMEDTKALNRTHRVALCPAYRGRFYQQEIQRFAEAVKTVQPDLIFHDIECWGWGCAYASKCKTCLDYKEKLGIADLDEFLYTMGREHMVDLEAAIAGFYPDKAAIPPAGIYGLKSKKTLSATWNPHLWEKLHPDLIAFSQPSLYTGGNIMKIHQTLLEEFKNTGKRITIPWLTTGEPVEFDPRKVEAMLYTAFLDGVGGITYYAFFHFDTPLDFYYHAKAIATLAPYEELLSNGSPAAVVGDNQALLTCAWHNPKVGALVLIYNHVSDKTENIKWSFPEIPQRSLAAIKNLSSGKSLRTTKTLETQLKPGECQLYLLENKTKGN